MNMRILGALLSKEFTLMRRDPIIPKVILVMPLMVMLVIPLVANLEVKHVGIAVVDNDHSQLSRRITADLNASPYLSVNGSFGTYNEAMQFLERDSADVIVTIPRGYSKSLTLGEKTGIDLASNGVNATKGALGGAYTAASIGETLREWHQEAGVKMPEPEAVTQYLYNPTLDFRNYMIPALMVMLLIIICGFMPALSLVNEKQQGTIEAINVTPVGKIAFVMSKLIPYWIAGMIVVTIAMSIGRLVYGLSPAGSVGAIYLAAFTFTLVMSGLGVIIANKSNTMLQSILVMFAVIMVFQLMSGLFTPVSSMPKWAQTVTYAVPPRYFIEIVRGIYLKGTTVAELAPQYLILGAMAAVLCGAAAMTYRKQS